MAPTSVTGCTLLVVAVSVFKSAFAADAVAKNLRQRVLDTEPSSFVRNLEFHHRLRVCNAYPSQAALDVYSGTSQKLTSTPLAYKDCNDFSAPLHVGDKLEFMIGDTSAGTFSVSDLPSSDAVLLLVIHRHDVTSTAVSFESHVFANLMNPQIAVIDTFKGNATSAPKIEDVDRSKVSRSEQLRFGSVVAVNPGEYQVVLEGSDGREKGRNSLIALNREAYVVIRTGVASQEGESFPEEEIVFPKSDASLLHRSSAATLTTGAAAAVAFIASVMFAF